MKWSKMPYFGKANTHRAGWKFWDLLDGDGTVQAFIRYVPDKGYTTHACFMADTELDGLRFDTLKAAKEECTAHFVLKKLEDE